MSRDSRETLAYWIPTGLSEALPPFGLLLLAAASYHFRPASRRLSPATAPA